MTDKLNEQISAFIDDELMSEESELLVRRLCGDEALRRTAARYTLAGEAIRGSLHQMRADLNGNIMRAIEAEGPPSAPQAPQAPQETRRAPWMRVAGGGAIAAAVAVIAVLAIRPGQSPIEAPPAAAVRSAEVGDVVPPDRDRSDLDSAFRASAAAPLVLPASTQTQLERYLLRHNQYSKTTMRQGILVYRTMATEEAPVEDETDESVAAGESPRQ